MKIEPLSSEQIVALWQALELGEVQTLTVPQRGCSNACFLVNADRVVRFQVTELPRHKFRTEQIAYDLLRDSELPVPEVLVLDESQTLVPYAFLVTTRLPTGVSAVNRNGATGFAVVPGDAAALRDALSVLCKDDALRSRMGAAAKAVQAAEYSSRLMGDRFVALYETIR